MSTVDADLQAAKALVLDYHDTLDRAMHRPAGSADRSSDILAAVARSTAADYGWRGMHPFYEQEGAEAVVASFLAPLADSFSSMTRRPDVFLAGQNDVEGDRSTWVCQMGHLVGLFDRPWLDIPPTGRMAFIRYAEFNRVDGDRIAETALFIDVISVMAQAGQYPLPPPTGASFMHPGPRTHDGLLVDAQDPVDGKTTMELVNRMVADLDTANAVAAASGDDRMPRAALSETWHDDMIWYGPEGIGATCTIDRYRQQHQHPFRFGLTDKVFNGHVARFAEGNYACFFGWSNLTNRPAGGFLGLPASRAADMRVVDVYRRDGDKLAENWVFIDLLHWLSVQGLDVLARMRQLIGVEEL